MGVCPKKNGRFGAKIVMHNRQVWLGMFDTRDDAEAAVVAAREAYQRTGQRHRPFIPPPPPLLSPRWLALLEHGPESTYESALRSDPCSYCGGPCEELDHIEPRARGADRYGWDNFTAACVRCNRSKRATTLLRFLVVRQHRVAIAEHEEQIDAWDLPPDAALTVSGGLYQGGRDG